MILRKADIDDFRASSAHIRQTGIIPVLDYLLIGGGQIIKTNLQSFVKKDVAGAYDKMLVEEKKLMNFCSLTTATDIEIKMVGNTVVITDGEMKTKHDTASVHDFPATAVPEEGGWVALGNEFISNLALTAQFTDSIDSSTYQEFVFVGDGYVVGSNGFIGCFIKQKTALPATVLHREVAGAMPKLGGQFDFLDAGNYQYFRQPGVVYGFNKQEMTYKNLAFVADKVPQDGNAFTVNKSAIIDFCSQVVADSPLKTLTATMANGLLAMNDNAYNYEAERPVVGMFGDFNFNPALLARLLKAVVQDEVTFMPTPTMCFVKAGENMVCIIMAMQK